MKISIVTAYYNRRQLLINTLKSISKTSHNDFEVIVVDDGSTEENKIDDLPNEFPFLKGHFMVFSAPTILFLENGKETYRKAGVFSLEQTIYELENHIFNQIQDPNVNLY